MERLWKSVKYEEVCLHACDTVGAANQGLARCLTVDSQCRLHLALDRKIVDSFYYENLSKHAARNSGRNQQDFTMKQEILSK